MHYNPLFYFILILLIYFLNEGNSKWRAVDSVIGKEGFRVVLLLRLSPLLPFAISNYLYGITAVDFWSDILSTTIIIIIIIIIIHITSFIYY